MICILGTGFGLYGYLPALAQGYSQKIVLTERARKVFLSRQELRSLATQVIFKNDESEALSISDGVVLALPPKDQEIWIQKILSENHNKFLFLEKPLGHSPITSKSLLDDLMKSNKKFRIAYIFRQTPWAEQCQSLIQKLDNQSTLRFTWLFKAHHFQNNLKNWKQSHCIGGGALRFYGIHLIAFFAELGYHNVVWSKTHGSTEDDISSWWAYISGPQLPNIEVRLDSNSPLNQYKIEYQHKSNESFNYLIDQADPLEDRTSIKSLHINQFDRRFSYLVKHCYLPMNDQSKFNTIYLATNDLWEKVEIKNEFIAHPFSWDAAKSTLIHTNKL